MHFSNMNSGADLAVIDWVKRLKCSQCGSRQVDFVLTGARRTFSFQGERRKAWKRNAKRRHPASSAARLMRRPKLREPGTKARGLQP